MSFRELELYQHNLETAAASALELLSEIIGVDTLFVATNDGKGIGKEIPTDWLLQDIRD